MVEGEQLNNRRRLLPITAGLFIILAAILLGSGQMMAEDEEPSDSSGFEALDTGVDTIDVSKYPKEMQAKYEVVKAKCGQCHSMARVINSEYALEDEWKRYIKRMRRKPGSKIKKAQAKEIWEFLVYDSKQRKADLIKAKTAPADSTGSGKK